ncbi:tetratricopeptide repeat protein [Puteibacter caeruleilacunae]|nr:tetratricopeptide repeat protein [Puteibacter caeruleilacunae]
MKKLNYKPLASLFFAALLMSGCAGLKKMKKHADQIQFKVTPEVLEANGGDVDMALSAKFPERYFHKKVKVVATPVLKYDGGEKAFESFSLQGERVEDNNKVISYLNGGSFSYNDAVAYANDMRKSDLELRITASKGSKTLDFDPIKIGDGVIATSTLMGNCAKPVLGVQREKNTTGKYDPNIDVFQRIVPDEFMADIHYLINSSYVRGSELKGEDLDAFKAYAKDAFEAERKDLKNIEVSAYASPDGEQDWNTKLSERREGTASKYVKRQMKREKIEADFKSKFTPEDWEGFQELMKQSSIQDKDLILRVLSMYSDPEVREKEIRNLSAAFTQLADDILPKLRRAKITASVDLIGKTDEEIAALADSDPSKLNPAELLYAATLTEDNTKKLAIYNSFTKVYSNDWRGFNNMGLIYIKTKKVADAKKVLEQADKLSPKNPIISNNLGAVALMQGDVKKAEALFGGANGAGENVSYNLGLVELKKGNYDAAVKYFGNNTSLNVALAKLLAGDNNGALKVINGVKKDCPKIDYVKAVIGARTAKTNLMFDSLKAAVKKDAKFKAMAKTDLEFAKYFEDAKFKAIVD